MMVILSVDSRATAVNRLEVMEEARDRVSITTILSGTKIEALPMYGQVWEVSSIRLMARLCGTVADNLSLDRYFHPKAKGDTTK